MNHIQIIIARGGLEALKSEADLTCTKIENLTGNLELADDNIKNTIYQIDQELRWISNLKAEFDNQEARLDDLEKTQS